MNAVRLIALHKSMQDAEEIDEEDIIMRLTILAEAQNVYEAGEKALRIASEQYPQYDWYLDGT